MSNKRIPTALGVRLKMEIIRRNMTSAELAKKIGIPTRQYMYAVMYGDRRPGKYVFKIANFLGISLEQVINLSKNYGD